MFIKLIIQICICLKSHTYLHISSNDLEAIVVARPNGEAEYHKHHQISCPMMDILIFSIYSMFQSLLYLLASVINSHLEFSDLLI